MDIDEFSLPDLDMPDGRAAARHEAFVQEMRRTGRIGASSRRPAGRGAWKVAVPVLATGLTVGTVLVSTGTGQHHAGGTTALDQATLVKSWTAAPAAFSPGELDSWGRRCLSLAREAQLPNAPLPPGDRFTLSGEVAEQRGRLVLVLVSSEHVADLCVYQTDGKIGSLTGHLRRPTISPTGINVLTGSGSMIFRDGPQLEFQSFVGQVGSKVARVVVQTADGRTVQATVANGFYIAWWPGSLDTSAAVKTTAYAADGTVVAQLVGEDANLPDA